MKCLVFDVENNFVIYNLYVYMNSFLWKNKLNMDMFKWKIYFSREYWFIKVEGFFLLLYIELVRLF